MNINIDYQARTPIYEQIVDSIETQVSLGLLKPDDQLPSIRDLAVSLGINPNTVKKSYSILESRGVIVIKSTKGTFIAKDTKRVVDAKIDEVLNQINSLIADLENLGLSKSEIIKRIKEKGKD